MSERSRMSKTIKRVVVIVGFGASLVTLYVFFNVEELFKQSDWKIEEMEVSGDLVAYLNATETTEDEATLMVTCGRPTPLQLNVVVDWHYALTSVDSMWMSVQFRFDAEQFVSDQWFRTDTTAVMIGSTEKTLRFLNKARRSDKLEVQILSESVSTMSATFDLHGIGDIISAAVEACDLIQ